MDKSMIQAAVILLNDADLSFDTKCELIDQYQEDLEEHSDATALEKLENGIAEARRAFRCYCLGEERRETGKD